MPTHVHLVPIDAEFERALDGEPGTFLLRYRADPGEAVSIVRDVVRRTLSLPPPRPPWGAYMAFDELGRMAVGTCGFKGMPDAAGSVEIAYSTFSAFEGRGYATSMAARLLEIAWGASGVDSVVAHTKPELNASTRVLEKLGFARGGEVVESEDGTVWRWARARPGRFRGTPSIPVPA
ncbi:MAG: GNAT family N-acetyltransferase [Gemmatimonadota bacterium]